MDTSVTSRSYSKQASIAGFTLIELMVTIAIMAIIVSIAAPSISTQLANQRIRSTTATLTNALKEAKAESIIRRQNVTLTYDNSSNPRVIKIADTSSTPNLIASYNYDAKSTIKPATATVVIFQPSKVITAAVTYTICDSNTSVTPRQILISKVANITNQTGGTCP